MKRSPLMTRITAVIAAILLLAASTGVPAQTDSEKPKQPEAGNADNAAQASAEGEDEDKASSDSILNMIWDSGVTGVAFMLVLAVCSIVSVTVAVERGVHLQSNKVIPPEFLENLEPLLDGENRSSSDYQRLCNEHDSTLATILMAGVMRMGQQLSDIEKALEDAAAREMAAIRARIRPLNTIGGIAPLVGLLGTVIGMIVAFHTASQAGLGKAELLAKGIYMALLTTAGGLSVAIPSLVLATYFHSRAEKLFRQIDELLMRVPSLFAGALTPTVATVQPTKPAAAGANGSEPKQEAQEEKAKERVDVPPVTEEEAEDAPLTFAQLRKARNEGDQGQPSSKSVEQEVTPQSSDEKSKAKPKSKSVPETVANVSPSSSSKAPASSQSKNNPLMD